MYVSDWIHDWVSSRQRQETSLKQPDWLWVPSSSVDTKCSLPAVKGLGSEADHSSLSSVEANNEWYFTSSPPCFRSVHRNLDLDIIIQRIMCTVICLWVVPQYGVTLQTVLTLILPRSRMGTVWFYTSASNKRAARPKLYTKSLTRDLKLMYSRFTLVRISINL